MGGWGVWGYLGAWEGVPTCTAHARAHMHMHTHTHTCIELQMAASMEASMFSMFSMFNMHVRAFVHACDVRVHACMHGTPPHTPIPYPNPIHPSATPPGGWTPGIT